MATFTLCGDDTLTLNGRNITQFIDGSVLTINHPNESTTLTTGKDGNSVYAKNEQGSNVNMTLRLIRGADDDEWLNGRLIAQRQDLVHFILFNGTYVKRLGEGVVGGRIRGDIYTLIGGVFVLNPDTMFDTTGSPEQGVTVYQLRFASGERVIG